MSRRNSKNTGKEQESLTKISSHKLNKSFSEESWEVEDADKITPEDSSSGRLSAFYLSTLKQQLNSNDQKVLPEEESPSSPVSSGQTGVMDAAERAIHRVADARDEIQKKTFTKWVNQYLAKVNRNVGNLYEDLRDGHNLISLLEVLSGVTLRREENYLAHMRLPREKGHMRFHRLQNVNVALDFLKQRKIRLVNIRSDDITDGNPKLILGLVWTIILHFQIEEISFEGSEDLSAKQALLIWAQRNMDGYDDINVKNFTSSWSDGKAFNVILHRNGCDIIDMDEVIKSDNNSNLGQAFGIAEKEFGITRLLDPEDVNVSHPDERSIITYVSSLYDMFPQIPPLPIKITEEQWIFAWEEYLLLKSSILEWIQEQIIIMKRTKEIEASKTLAEVEHLQYELERFKAENVPQKEADLQSLIPKYQIIEQMSEESRGKYQPVSGNEPMEVLSAWETFTDAIKWRTIQLSSKHEKLKFLNDIVCKLNRGAVECHKNLEKAECAIKQMANGDDNPALQKDANDTLDSCQAQIQSMYADVQILKDEDCAEADSLYKTVFALHEKSVQLRSEYNLALQQLNKLRLEAEKQRNAKVEDTREYSFLENCIRLADEYQASMENLPWGSDLPGVKTQVQEFGLLQHKINELSKDKVACQLDQKKKLEEEFDDMSTYDELLAILESKMERLEETSKTRKTQLDNLFSFISEATEHLMWMQEKEDTLCSKDISSFDLATMEQTCMVLTGEYEARKPHIIGLLQAGKDLDNHPAFDIVASYLTTITEQWEFLEALLLCLEQHIKDVAQQQSFDNTCSKCEDAICVCNDKLSAIEDELRKDEKLENVSSMNEQLNVIDEDIKNLQHTIDKLVKSSSELPCVKERNMEISDEMPLTSLCKYTGKDLVVAKNEDCTLLENKDGNYWTVRTFSTSNGGAPSLVFRMSPFSKINMVRAENLAVTMMRLSEHSKTCTIQLRFYTVLSRFTITCQSILTLTIEDFKKLSPSDKANMLVQLSDDLSRLNKLGEETEGDEFSTQIELCNAQFQQCSDHVAELSGLLDKDNKHEEKCQTYLSQLNVFMKRLNDLQKFVVIRVLSTLPDEKTDVEAVLDDHKTSVEELGRCEPHYHQVCEESRAVVEENPDYPASQQLSSQVDVVVVRWKSTWNITHMYFDKLKMVNIMLGQINDVDRTINNAEEKLTSSDADYQECDFQKVMEKKSFIQNLQFTVNAKSEVAEELKENNKKLQEISTQVDYPISVDSACQATDDDVQTSLETIDSTYADKVDSTLDRLQKCQNAVSERLGALTDILPEAEKIAAEESTCRSFSQRVNGLQKKIDAIDSQQTEQLSTPLPENVDAIQQCLDDQQNVLYGIELLKPEYDALQAEIVNFINNEAKGKAKSLVQLRDELHILQKSWSKVWLITHVYFEKIKGLLHIVKGMQQVEGMVKDVQDVVEKCDPIPSTLSELRTINQQIELRSDTPKKKEAIKFCPAVDNNFDVLKSNVASTQEVVAQFPEDSCTSDEVNDSHIKVMDLLQTWKDLKERLQQLSVDSKAKLSDYEKAEELRSQLGDIMKRVQEFNKEMNSVLESQKIQISMPQSLDVAALEKNIAKQYDASENLHLQSGQYYALCADCSDNLNVTQADSAKTADPLVTELCDEHDSMVANWEDANETVDVFYSKLKDLKVAVEKLKALQEVVDHNENILSKHAQATNLALLKRQKEEVLKLMEEIPCNDEVAVEANNAVDALMNTRDRIRGLEKLDDDSAKSLEISQCKENVDSLTESWENAKKEIARQLATLDDAINREENEAKYNDDLIALLDDVENFRAEMSKVESGQFVRADVMLPTDEGAVGQIIGQQQSIVNQLADEMKERYEDISSRCRAILSSDVTLPSMSTLHTNFTKMCLEWEKLNILVVTYMTKLHSVQEFWRCYAIALAALKTYQVEVQRINSFIAQAASGYHDTDEIIEAKHTIQCLKEQVDNDEIKVADTLQALERCRGLPNASSNQDIPALVEKSNVLDQDWANMKKALRDIELQLADELTLSEKRDVVNKQSEDIHSVLINYQKDLDAMKNVIQARICVTLPPDVETIQAVVKQEEEMGGKLKLLKCDGEELHSRCEDLKEMETPAVKQLEAKFVQFFENWAVVYRLHEECMKKLKCTTQAAEALCVCEGVIYTYANQLAVQDSMADNKEGLEQQRVILQKLADEAPEHDSKFESMMQDCQELQEVNNLLKERDLNADGNFNNVADQLNERWGIAKEQVAERLSLVLTGEDKFNELEKEVDQHHSLLQEKENIVNQQDVDDVDQRSADELKNLIEDAEKLQDSLTVEYTKVDHMYELSNEFDSVARKYDQVAATYDDPAIKDDLGKTKPSMEEIEDRACKRQKIIEYKVVKVTQRFDKLKNLISERIEKYKIAYKIATDEETNSTTTTTTEITTTTTKKMRNLLNIKFDTYLRRQASAFDLHDAGIVPDEMAEKLEMGLLREQDVESELKAYLKGTEPIAGLIIKKADNKKVSISTAIKLGLVKSGTGLVLLEAQAGTGNIIDPLTAEHMSVAEAVEKGLIDTKHEDALKRAERAVTGYEDPVTHKILSLYECMKKGFIVESHGIRLLEAQIATGGLIDPRANHRVPISVAYRRGLFDERINKILEDPTDDTKGFFDPNTEKNHTYLDLVNKCVEDKDTKLLFLEITSDKIDVSRLLDENGALKKQRSRMDIRFSTAYHDEAMLDDIYDAGLVTEEQVRDLESGLLTEEDLYEQLKPYLFGGEEPVCGVIVEETGEMLSIMEATNRGIIKRGTGIELLEAQAATGNIIVPKTASKMSVANAYKKGLIDRNHVDTLERAERAVKGYRVPGTDQILSLFGAMKKGLVVESRGIRLLEAQIATGGLIDPKAHHRVPISVAYQRGLFDQRMNDILEDPSDDTKGFFDPNTEENLSYLDLMQRCEIRPPANFRFLVIKPKKKKRSRTSSKKSPVTKTVQVEEVDAAFAANDRKHIKFPTMFNVDVSLEDLVKYEIVPESTAADVEGGRVTRDELSKIVRPFLYGSPSISGVHITTTGEKLSFLEATKRNLMSRDEAFHYLEAQACTGGIINPKNGETLSVLDAYMSGLIERRQIPSLQQAEEVVFGHLKLGSKLRMTFAEMVEKEVVNVSQASRYIHCQLATGGVVDAKRCIRLSRESPLLEACVGPRLTPCLNGNRDAIYIDPTSKETKSYEEVIKSCKQDTGTRVNLLQCSPQNESTITTETTTVTTTKYKTKKRTEIYFETHLNRRASLVDLLNAGIVTEETVTALEEGKLSEEEVAQSIRQYLVGEQPIAGIIIEATGQKCRILECVRNGIIKRGTGLELLEAQAATGSLIEPTTGERFGVREALQHHLIDGTQVDAMERALRAVTGYKNPVTKGVLSLFAAMNKGYVTESRGVRLLEAQVATGGLIDPLTNHRVPLSVAYERGIISRKMFGILTDPSDDTKGFFDPNTNENLTYLELISRCKTEPSTGLVFLTLRQKKEKSRHSRRSSSKKKRTTQRSRKVVIIDPSTGAELSIKEAYNKGLIDKAAATQLLEQEGEWTEENEMKPEETSPSSSETTTVQSLSLNTSLNDMTTKPPLPNANGDVAQKDLFHEHLQARLQQMASGYYEPISGIADVKKGDCISFKEAEKRRLIDRTSLQRLLEAQAATGGLINPADRSNRRYTLNEAVASGLIDRRLAQKIEMAEKAAKGFYNTRTKETLSLGQAMKKGLCYFEIGSRFLEFQCCTGGLIDPKDGSRVSLEDAVARDWIDNRTMSRLKNFQRYSKSIVDLKTNLLMTYPEALSKSIVEPITGHRLLEALPRLDRNLRMGSGITIQASSLYGSRASSLAGSLGGSPESSSHNSRRGSFDDDNSFVRSPSRT